jgi:hypothetical protein
MAPPVAGGLRLAAAQDLLVWPLGLEGRAGGTVMRRWEPALFLTAAGRRGGSAFRDLMDFANSTRKRKRTA